MMVAVPAGLRLEGGEAPDRHDETDADEPIRPRRSELPRLPLRFVALAMLPDRKAVPGEHRQADRKHHQHQQAVQVENLDDIDVVHARDASGLRALGYF